MYIIFLKNDFMKTKILPCFILLAFLFFVINIAQAQPQMNANRVWSGQGDGHSWTDGNNWSPVLCHDTFTDTYTYVYTMPTNGEIVEFINTGNISVTGCPFIILGNVPYDNGGYNHCSGVGPSSAVGLYSMQIDPFSYVTLDNTIVAGGLVSQSAGTNINTALEIDQGRLTCQGLGGNFAADGSSTPLNMNSIKATNSIIEITNPGTGGGFSPSGRTYFNNCTITCTAFQPYSNNAYPSEKDSFNNCTINTATFYCGPYCIARIYNSTFNISGGVFAPDSYGYNNSVVLDNVQINANNTSTFTIEYRAGSASIKGNITCFNKDSAFQLLFQNGDNPPTPPTPFYLDGNLIVNGGSIFIGNNASLEITGNLEMNGTPDPNLMKDVMINGQKAFEAGGYTNYANYNYGSFGPIPGNFRFGLKFSGSTDSHIKWPTGFPVDTLIIEKSNCARVYFDGVPLHVTGKLQVNSGQLVLASHPVSNYTLVNGGDLEIRNGGSISIGPNADVAVGGNFVDNNPTVNNSTCNGFSNAANNTIAFYNNQYTPVNRFIGSASNSSVGNVKFINQANESYTLQNDFVADNFDLGNNGKIILGNNNFRINGALTNYDNSNYFITNGTGSLTLQNIATTPVLFPVGISESSYTPVIVANNGTIDNYKVRVQEGLYNNGDKGVLVTEKAVNRTWFIEEEVGGGSNANVTLQWNAEDELGGFDRNDAFLLHYINNSWDFGTPLPVGGTSPYQLTRNNITSFSPFAISNQNIILPLILINFNILKQNTSVQLNWQTTSEKNFSFFGIERSNDGIIFSNLNKVPASFNNSSIKNYSYTDNTPINGTDFYRLKMTDADGKFTYSKIVAIRFDGKNSALQIFPNPAKDILHVQVTGSNGKAILQIIDVNGRKVEEQRINLNGTTSVAIDINDLPKGTYNLLLKSSTLNEHEKFIKQ